MANLEGTARSSQPPTLRMRALRSGTPTLDASLLPTYERIERLMLSLEDAGDHARADELCAVLDDLRLRLTDDERVLLDGR